MLFVTALFFTNLLASTEYLGRMGQNSPGEPPNRVRASSLALPVLRPPEAPPVPGPLVSLIVDDVGEDLALLEQLANVRIPLTVSVIPGSPFDRESASWANENGMEVMVHLPMEPSAFPIKDPGANALLASMNRRQLAERTALLVEEIPFAVGVNNHMGSRLTSRREKMNIVLNVLAREGMFFIDSRTTATTIGYKLAQEKQIPSAERTLFLDNPDDVMSVRVRFEQLVALARVNGTAVGICHLKPETIEQLRKIDISRHADIRFDFASAAVR